MRISKKTLFVFELYLSSFLTLFTFRLSSSNGCTVSNECTIMVCNIIYVFLSRPVMGLRAAVICVGHEDRFG